MRVLVTGGSGYLGRAIVLELARQGHTPVVFARHAAAAGLPGVAIDGDVRARADVLRAAQDADAVCHAAALVSIWRPREADFAEINVGGLKTVLDVCSDLRTPRIIYTSSFLALPPRGATAPLAAGGYQRSKVEAHAVARAAASAGAPIVTLIPGVIYGPGPPTEANLVGRLLRDYVNGRLPGVVGASRVWSYAFIEDVAAAHVNALTSGRTGDEYPIGGENAPQMRLFEIARQLTGRPLPRSIPFTAARAAAAIEETRARMSGKAPLLTRGVVEIFRHDWPLDSDRSVAELSYRVTPMETGVSAVLQAALGE